MIKRFAMLLCLLMTTGYVLAADTTAILRGGICINEILPDPNGANNFDTDGNGTFDGDDEFLEIYNLSGGTINIGGLQLWDAGGGLTFTFPDPTNLGPGNFAVVVTAVQAGGSLPAVGAGNFAFDAAFATNIYNNGGDNLVLYDPTADEYVQALYNGDGADNPPVDYAGDGFSGTATRVGPVEDFGSDTDGLSRQRSPAGDTNVVNGASGALTPGFPVELKSFVIEDED